MTARASGRIWPVILVVLGLIAGLLGVDGRGARAAHGEEADVDFAATYRACVGAATESAGFEDTVGSFAEDEINCLKHYGITQGRSAAAFAPSESVLRWQMALFLSRAAAAAGIVLMRPAADQGFTDIGAVSEDARNAINGLAMAGIMPGVSSAAFSPNTAVNRGQMAVILDAFLRAARPGPGAFGLDADEYSDVTADDFAVFDDVRSLPLNAYHAVYRIYEAGITEGVGDHQYGPDRNVTRAQMAAFIMRTLAHTVARPAGVSVQAMEDMVLGQASVELAVSVRDASFQPIEDAYVDVFSSAEPDDAFAEDGACDAGKVDKAGGVGVAACEVDGGDELTNANGDVTGLSVQVTDADVTVWAWTGDRGAEFEADDVAAARLTVAFSKAASQLLVTDNLAEGQTHLTFGETATVTLQVADEDDAAVADKGKTVSVSQATVAADGSRTGAGRTYSTDADGKIVLEFTQTDPDAATTGQSVTTALTLSGAPEGLPLQDEDGDPFTAKTFTWSDETPVPTTLTVTTRNDYAMATDEGGGGENAVTAALTDQFGNPLRGKRINFFSDTVCAPAPERTTCATPGIGAEGTGAAPGEEGGMRVLTGEARFTRTTGRNGTATLAYAYDSADGVIETIWATYAFQGTEGVRGAADTAADRPDDDPDDETTLTSDRAYHFWAEEPSGVPFTGRILVKDVDDDMLVVGAGERVMLVQYDSNDQLHSLSGPSVFADFQKDLADNADPAAAHLRVRHYAPESGEVSVLLLRPEWARLDHPDGQKAGAAARFGEAMAVDGGVIVVGAPRDNVTSLDPDTGPGDVDDDADPANDESDDIAVAGMVYIYPNGIDTAPSDIVKLSPPIPQAGTPLTVGDNWGVPSGYFGWDVDVSGDTIVVGTRIAREVYVYVRRGGVWPAAPTATLSRADDWRFGEGVAVSGDESTIAVAMTNGWRADIPRVIIYEKPGSGWADDANAGDNAELKDSSHPYLRQEVRAVALSEDGSVVVSGICEWSWSTGCEGAVNVHVRPGAFGSWADAADADATLVAKGGPKAAQSMGKYVAVDDAGSTIIASGSFNAGFADEPGVAYVFSKPDMGGWAALDEAPDAAAELSVSRGRTDDVFGQYVAVSADGSEAAAGRHYRQEGDFRGSVAVFKRPDGGWADDGSPDEELLGDAPGARLGWQPAYDGETGDLYAGIFDEAAVADAPPGARLLSVFKLDR